MYINKNTNFGTHNTSVRNGSIKYIVIHYVGAVGDAKANINYYNNKTSTRASADFYVGHKGDIWQYNPDPLKRYCWAVGGGKQSKYGGTLYKTATNSNCVSIEMCVTNVNGNMNSNSNGWNLSAETRNSTVELTKYLMGLYNIDVNHVIRHFDVNGKACPGLIGWNTFPGNNENAWIKFKQDLIGVTNIITNIPTSYKYSIGNNVYVAKHYVSSNDNNAVMVNPVLPMKILNIVEGSLHPYHTNYNTYCGDLDITGIVADNNVTSKGTISSNISYYAGVPVVFSQNLKDLQHALNADGFTDTNGKKLKEDGFFGEKTYQALCKVCLSTKTIYKYINVTAWVQCRVGAKPDGLFGKKETKSCVEAYQEARGLKKDAIVGKDTLLQLVKDYI